MEDLWKLAHVPDSRATSHAAPAGADSKVDHDNDYATAAVYGYDSNAHGNHATVTAEDL